ncbi:MAG: acetamidase/formamidase family protein [Candidatus Korobacteraceae bacterium]
MKSKYLLLLAIFTTPALAHAQSQSSHGALVTYKTTLDNVKTVFAPAPPVATLHPGDILDTNTLDCFAGVLKKPGDTLSMVKMDNPLSGPFYVEGAEPGDTLAVKFLDLTVDGDQGVGTYSPGFGAISTSSYTPMLNTDLPERIWFYPIDKASNMATFKAADSNFTTKIPLHPFMGCVGDAPADGEARSSIVPAEFGGNMDSPEASVGNTLYLPVSVKGALLYLGDGHAAMGDGEIAGSAIEVPMHVRVQVDVIKGQKIAWPRFENDDYLMATGIYRPLEDAARIAFTELVKWIHQDYGLSELDTYELLSKVAEVRLSEMVDPNYVVIAKINKKYLPPKKIARK